jgi:hypothetical protein
MRFSKRIFILAWMVLVTLPAAGVLAAPPKVIETVPKNGDPTVDPNLKEMRFVFDQDMATGGYSICGGGPQYPKVTGRPQWINKRTLAVRVTLEADHEYRLSINCPPNATNCRSASGEPAATFPMSFKTAAGSRPAVPKVQNTVGSTQAVQNLRKAIDEQYSYRDLRKLDWGALFTKYGPAMEGAAGSAAFAQAAAEMLGQAKDMHIWLEVGGKQIPSYKRDVARNYNHSVLEKAVPGFRKLSEGVYSGRFEDGIGYILIDSWSSDRTEALEQAYAVIWECSDAPGLIVDVRPNGGGAEPLAQQFAGCFVDKPVVYAKHVYRSAKAASGFDEPHDRILEPNKYRPKYRGKVVVLMGQTNMSSCESFLLMMKQVPGCKLIGSTSYGSSGNPKPTDLGNGVTVYLPSWKDLRPDGTCLEGQGITPDIPITVTLPALESTDPVLQAALTLLRKR